MFKQKLLAINVYFQQKYKTSRLQLIYVRVYSCNNHKYMAVHELGIQRRNHLYSSYNNIQQQVYNCA